MLNIKPQIYNLLKQIPNIEVVYFYPQSFTTVPLVVYSEIVNIQINPTLSGEEELFSTISYQLDVYCNTSSECSDVAIQADALMRSKGFKRSFAMDNYDFENGMYRKVMRYSGTINNRTQEIL